MTRRFALAICASLTLAIPTWSADELPMLKTKVKTVAAFKNGLGFVFRTGTTDLADGWATMDQIPAAALGTLWIGTTGKSGPVQDVISYKEKQKKQLQAITLTEILAANVGKLASVTYVLGGSAGPTTLDGTILSVPEDRTSDTLPPGTRFEPPVESRGPMESRSQIVLISTDRGTLALNKSSIVAVNVRDGETGAKVGIEMSRAKFRVGGNPTSAEVTMAYLEKGIIWSPSYLVNIANDKEAEITLESVLANDVEDLDDAEVSFVVGYPNFMFANSMTPLALQQTVASFVQGLMGSSNSRDRYSNVMSQSIMTNSPAYSERGEAIGNAYSATTLPGESNEDLYFYRQEHVTLKKGDRARYTVFSSKAPYEHIYQWDVPDSMNINDQGGRTDNGRPNAEEVYQVWHSLRLDNTTKLPWTTAPAFTVNGAMPVAQDVLKYTSPGGKNTLKLTVATDIKADQAQTEASRTQTTVGHNTYDQVLVNGTLKVKNWMKKPAKMSVTKSLVGEVKEAGQDGKTTKVVKKLTAVNPTSEIAWEFNLEPGQEKELSYQYQVLIYR